jgi:alpha-beta hydrolase superfamily lysophospholipase
VSNAIGHIPLRVYPPADAQIGDRGAVLLLHGLRVDGTSLEREARWLAAAGFTAFVPDAPHHGGRHSEVLATMPDALTLEGHRILLRILREARDEIPRLVDHVLGLGHPHVTVVGVSMGALIALAAATIEPRLAAIVSILGTPDWTPRDGVVPEDLAAAVAESPHRRLGTFPPRPLLLLNGSRDDSVRPGPARDFVASLRPLYAARPNAGPLVLREYDSEHAVSEPHWIEMWMTTMAFLAGGRRQDVG